MTDEQKRLRIEIARAVEEAYRVGYADGVRHGEQMATELQAVNRRQNQLGEDFAAKIVPEL